jgi:hypothetical protein
MIAIPLLCLFLSVTQCKIFLSLFFLQCTAQFAQLGMYGEPSWGVQGVFSPTNSPGSRNLPLMVPDKNDRYIWVGLGGHDSTSKYRRIHLFLIRKVCLAIFGSTIRKRNCGLGFQAIISLPLPLPTPPTLLGLTIGLAPEERLPSGWTTTIPSGYTVALKEHLPIVNKIFLVSFDRQSLVLR